MVVSHVVVRFFPTAPRRQLRDAHAQRQPLQIVRRFPGSVTSSLFLLFASSSPESDSRILNMPSRVFAAPLRQVDELTALSTHRDKENLASPVLAKGEYNFELALDFHSRKHVDPEASVEVYTFGLQEDVSSSHPSFPLPLLVSDNILRNYLIKFLQTY